MMGMDVRMVSPAGLRTSPEVMDAASAIAAETGATHQPTADVTRGVAGVDFVYTDVWLSMGEPPQLWTDRIELLADYAVSMEVLEATGNPDVKFMHCLPALHNRETAVGQRSRRRAPEGSRGERRRVRAGLRPRRLTRRCGLRPGRRARGRRGR